MSINKKKNLSILIQHFIYENLHKKYTHKKIHNLFSLII